MAKSKRYIYSKSLQGEGAQIFVAKSNVAYVTAGTTYATFVASGVDGQVGIFSAAIGTKSDDSFISVATYVAAGSEYFIAQWQTRPDGTTIIKKTPKFTTADIILNQSNLYIKPVRQVTTVGFNGTAGTTSGITTVTLNDEYYIQVIENTPQNQPYPTWDWNTLSGVGDTEASNMIRLVAQINNLNQPPSNTYAPPVVVAEFLANGTQTSGSFTVASGNVVFTKNSTNVTATGHNAAVGDYIAVDSTATVTTASNVYKVVAIATNSFTLDRAFTGVIDATATLTETIVNANIANRIRKVTAIATGGTGLRFTSIDFGRYFNVATLYSVLSGASIVYQTDFKNGLGDPDIVEFSELEGQVWAGVGVFNAQFSADWGVPTAYTNQAICYNSILLNLNKTKDSAGLPNSLQSQIQRIRLWTPVTATSLAIAVNGTVQTLISGTAVDPLTTTSVHTNAALVLANVSQ